MLLLLALLAGHGIDEPPAGHTLLRANGEVIGAWTSYGLLTASDTSFLWTPEEAVPAQFVWDAERLGGVFLVATSTGVFTSNTGCEWNPQITGNVVRFGRTNERLYAAVQNASDAGGLAYLKLDEPDGDWQQSSHWQDGLLIEAIEILDNKLWVSGFDGAGYFVAEIDDTTWSEVSRSATRRVLVAVDTNGLWLGDNNTTYRLDHQGQELFSIPQRFIDARPGADSSTEFLNDAGQRFSYDGQLSEPLGSATRLDRDAVAFDVTQSKFHFESRGQDLIAFADIRPRQCAPNSAAFSISKEAWPILQAQGLGPRTVIEPPDDGGCRNAANTPGAWFLIVCLGFWCRRTAKTSAARNV